MIHFCTFSSVSDGKRAERNILMILLILLFFIFAAHIGASNPNFFCTGAPSEINTGAPAGKGMIKPGVLLNGDYQVQLFPDTKFYLLCNINCQRDSFLILRNIQKGLIQRQRLDYISILMKDFVYLTGDGLINVHSSGYKDKLGT